ncbi:MAG: hypothetical protein L0229_01930 [Blastocatellia bacterium]|nr:hypothetical protein [Blastocatellia bacterium]
MATAKELFDAGDLRGAIEQLSSEVKSAPTDMQRRAFLFELLCFAGDYDRAEKQLDVIGHQSAQAEIGVQVYINNIKAERDRRRLYSDGLRPHFLIEPPAYIALHLDAINRLREGDRVEAREALDLAEERRPAFKGKLDGRQFSDLRDYDDLIGPVLEVIVQDRYTWVPFEQVRQIEISAPRQLRDLLWIPARIEALDGSAGEVFIQALYRDSNGHPDDRVKLGRMTDWTELGDGLYLASGLRLFLVDGEERPILEIRNIEFDASAATSMDA